MNYTTTTAMMALAAATITLGGAPAQAATNLFTNGGFENASFGSTVGYYNIGAGADHAVPSDFGWSIPVNNVDIVANNGIYAPAQSLANGGNYALDLVGYGSTGAISQKVSQTVAGQNYVFSFNFSANRGVTNGTAIVAIDGHRVDQVTADNTAWHSYSTTFTATGKSTVVSLTEGYGANNAGVFLDNLSLMSAATPPPVSPYAPAPLAAITHVASVPVLGAPRFAAPNLLGNGNFEHAGFGGTTSYYNLGNVGADHVVPADFVWTVPTNNVDLIANGAYGPKLATGGKYGLDLVGYGSTGSIAQPLSTIAGQRYRLSIDYSANGAVTNPTAAITLGGTSLGTLTGTPAWKTFTKTFTGTGTSASFNIAETYGTSNGGVFLDNAKITAFVPEPASWAMMIAGFGLVGITARRRRRAVAA